MGGSYKKIDVSVDPVALAASIESSIIPSGGGVAVLPPPRAASSPPGPPPPPPGKGRGPPPPPGGARGLPPPPGGARGPPPPPGTVTQQGPPPCKPPPQPSDRKGGRLPFFNWTGLNCRQVTGTVFNAINPNQWYERLDLERFYDHFEVAPKTASKAVSSAPNQQVASDPQSPQTPVKHKSLLKLDRLKQIAICSRKIKASADQITKATSTFDLKLLSIDEVDTLKKLVPTDAEREIFHSYFESDQPESELDKEERWLYSLCSVPRLQERLNAMRFMAMFGEDSNFLNAQMESITVACNTLMESKQFKALLEIIIALGNYMNGGKRPIALGFRLKALKVGEFFSLTHATV